MAKTVAPSSITKSANTRSASVSALQAENATGEREMRRCRQAGGKENKRGEAVQQGGRKEREEGGRERGIAKREDVRRESPQCEEEYTEQSGSRARQ
eukprot:871256-Rhodomonas_salina.1